MNASREGPPRSDGNPLIGPPFWPPVRLALLWVLVLALAPTVLAQGNETNATNGTNQTPTEPTAPAGPLDVNLEGHQEGGSFFWRIAGDSKNNPTITVAPGQQVVFHVKSVTGVHNLAVGDQAVSPVVAEGDSLDYAWTAPTTPGAVVYICKIHGAAMSGKVQVGEAAGGGGGAAEGGAITGEAIDMADVGHPECAGYKIPAIVTQHVTGGPTVDDYAKLCKTGGSTASARPPHPADYVIPISFGLIGLGIVGVVWAHRFYKP